MHFNFMKNQISFPVKYLLHEIKISDLIRGGDKLILITNVCPEQLVVDSCNKSPDINIPFSNIM